MYRYLIPLLLAIPGCANVTEPETEPTLVGPIVTRNLELALVRDYPSIHVRPADDECGIVFSVTSQTTIKTADAGSQGTFDDLTLGRRVRVWSRGGVVALSCPGQAAAEVVELLD